MIKPFHFSRVPFIIFKEGGLSALPGIVRNYGRKIVLVTGNRSFIGTSQAAGLIEELDSGDFKTEIIKIPGEPSPEMIDAAVAGLRDQKPDLIIAIGGGSALDAGKSIAAMIPVEGSLVDYLEDIGIKDHPGTRLPFIAIPTTSGTGSEATKNAVISATGKNGFKKSLRHENLVPDVAIVDPSLTLQCPPNITAASGMDCFTQLTEAYLSTKANEYTDALALQGIKAVKASLLRSYMNSDDIEARSGMSFAALTSGICLTNAGLGVVHGFASSIGGLYEIPHGLICGTLMAVTNEITVRKLLEKASNPQALKKYAKLGQIFLEDKNKEDDYYIRGFINCLHELTENLQLSGLKSSGVEESALDEICGSTGCKNNPVILNKDELMEILSRRLT